FRLASARFTYCLDQLFQSGQKSIMPDSEQGPARNIAHTGGFDDQRGRSSFRETPIPIEIFLSDEAVFSRPPGDHRRYPGAACECERTDVYRLKQQRLYGLVSRGPERFRNRMPDGVRELPNCVLTLSRRTFIGVRAWAEGWWNMPVSVGNEVGRIIGADPETVVMHQNVSICQSLILSCFLPLPANSKRNKIVYSELNFPSVMYVYEAHAREHGLRIETVKSDDGMTMPLERMLS